MKRTTHKLTLALVLLSSAPHIARAEAESAKLAQAVARLKEYASTMASLQSEGLRNSLNSESVSGMSTTALHTLQEQSQAALAKAYDAGYEGAVSLLRSGLAQGKTAADTVSAKWAPYLATVQDYAQTAAQQFKQQREAALENVSAKSVQQAYEKAVNEVLARIAQAEEASNPYKDTLGRARAYATEKLANAHETATSFIGRAREKANNLFGKQK